MERIVRKGRQVAGGYLLEIEVTQAYTDGRSRFDEVFVPLSAVQDKTPSQRKRALFDAVHDNALGDLRGTPVEKPPDDQDILEDRMVALYERWQRWKNTRVEAQARGVPQAVINALTNREDAVWSAYAAAILAWRSA